MKLLFDIASVVSPVFLVIFLGYGLHRFHLIDEEFTKQANRLVFTVCLPLLLFYKIGVSDFYLHFNGNMILGCAGAVVSVFLISYVFAAARGYSPACRGAFCQGAFRGNLAIIGLAVVLNAYGDEGLTRASVLMGFMVPLLNFCAIIALLLPHHEGNVLALPFWLRQILLNPLIIASFLGIFWSVSNLRFPGILDNTLRIITGLTLPLALLAIGAGFTLERLHGDLRRAGVAAGFKIVVMPAMAAFLLWMLGVKEMDFAVGLLMIGSPTAAVSYIMASQMKGDTELARSIIVLSTLFSILTYSLILLGIRVWGVVS